MNGIGDLLGFAVCDTTQFRSARNAANQVYQDAAAQNQLMMQQAGMRDFWWLTNMPQPKPSNVTPIRPERTPEEIQAQLEARYAEMEAEAERLRIHALMACSACRWAEKGSNMPYCYQPLITGLDVKRADRFAFDVFQRDYNALCGPEKALWEPIPTRWQRFTEWLARIIERLEGARG